MGHAKQNRDVMAKVQERMNSLRLDESKAWIANVISKLKPGKGFPNSWMAVRAGCWFAIFHTKKQRSV